MSVTSHHIQSLDNSTKWINGSQFFDYEVSEDEEHVCILYKFVLYCVIIGILVVLGFLGNSLSYCVFGKDKVKTSTLFLFQSLAVIDNFLLITVFPVYFIEPFLVYVLDVDPDSDDESFYGVLMAVISAYVFPFATVAQTATVWLTVLVAFNRYVAVCKPYKAARLCTVRQAKCQLTGVVLFSVVYNLPRFAQPYLEFNIREDNSTYYKIQAREFVSNAVYINVYDSALYLIIMLLLPLVVLNVLNIKLVKALKELNRKRVDMMQSARQKHDNNVTLVLIIVVVVFIVCQAPALVNRLMWSFLPGSSRTCMGLHFFISPLSNVFAVTNSSVNFIIYLAFNARFRQTIFESSVCRCLSSCFGGLSSARAQIQADTARFNSSAKTDCNCFAESTRPTENKTTEKSLLSKSNLTANSNTCGYRSLKLKQLVTSTNSSAPDGTFNNVTTTSVAMEAVDLHQNTAGHENDLSVQVYTGPVKE